MEGGVDGGVEGGVPDGVVGGCVGCTGDGPILDYDEAPKVVRQTKPQYPQEAFVKKIEGVVTVEFVIDAQGQVGNVRILKSIPLLDSAAIACIKQWIFTPARKGGARSRRSPRRRSPSGSSSAPATRSGARAGRAFSRRNLPRALVSKTVKPSSGNEP